MVRATCALHNCMLERELQATAGAGRGSASVPEEIVGASALREVTRAGNNTHTREAAGRCSQTM